MEPNQIQKNSESDGSSINLSTRLFTDGVLIAGVTAIAYAVAFAYEFGYCSNFGIPSYVITPSITTILVAFFSIVMVLLLVVMLGELLNHLPSDPRLSHLRRRLILFALLFALMTMASGLRWLNLLFLGPLLAELLIYILALFTYKGSIKDRLLNASADFESEPKKANPALLYVVKKIGIQGFSVLASIYICVALAFSVGSYGARNQSDFLVLAETPQLALVRIYGDSVILVDLTMPLKSPGSKFQIRRFAGDSLPLDLERRRVGQLVQYDPYSQSWDALSDFWFWLKGFFSTAKT